MTVQVLPTDQESVSSMAAASSPGLALALAVLLDSAKKLAVAWSQDSAIKPVVAWSQAAAQEQVPVWGQEQTFPLENVH